MYKTDERGTCMYMVHTSTFFPCRRALFARLKGMAFSPEPRFSKHLQNTSIVPTVPLIWIKNLSSIPGCYVFESRTSTYWLENIFLSFQIKWFRPELAVPLFYPHKWLLFKVENVTPTGCGLLMLSSPSRTAVFTFPALLSSPSCPADAVFLPCGCWVPALRMLSSCPAVFTFLPCGCWVPALRMLCSCPADAESLPCGCWVPALRMLSSCPADAEFLPCCLHLPALL